MISDNAIYTSVWDTIRTALTASTIYVTNSTTGATTRASVESKYSDIYNKPEVVIVPAEISENTFTYGSADGKKTINVTIECYYSNTLGMSQLSDQVSNLIKSSVVPNLGMDLIGITNSYSYAGTEEKKTHLNSITFTFDRQ